MPTPGDEPCDHQKRHDRETNRDHRLRNGERQIGCQASLVECHKLLDHGPSENKERDGGHQKDELGKQIERDLPDIAGDGIGDAGESALD